MRNNLIFLFILSFILILFSLFSGPVFISPFSIAKDELLKTIFFEIRLPRVLLAFIIGSSLSISGMAFQSIFQNPLVEPYILGISSGGALFSYISIFFPFSFFLKQPLFSFIGSIITIFLVLGIAKKGERIPRFSLLLSGIALSLLTASILSFLLYLSPEKRQEFFFYIFGSFSRANWLSFILMFLVFLFCFLYFIFNTREMDILLFGEEDAHTLGLSVERKKIEIIFIGSLLVGFSVAFSGIIGFVGLIIPHISRLIIGVRHKNLLWITSLIGGILLLFCDTISRTLINGVELPVGIFTSFLGVPFFLFLLKRGENFG